MAISIVTGTGYLCRHKRGSGFKLAIVVGYSGSRMRVCYWRAASAQWTKPTAVDSTELEHLLDVDKQKHERTIQRAITAAIKAKLVARVWSSEGVLS